ncbi:hypothetical protein BN1723_015625 [Verticillium longisporum]|nr:hypothetical protein BN1723_015625 [Verticillium longisporum]
MRLAEMDPLLDFWNLMAYDYAGSWDTRAGHQANLRPSGANPGATPFSTVAALEGYTASGVPADKIVLGMPLYGRAFENTDGPGCAYQGVGEGSWEQGVLDFKALPGEGAQEVEDDEVGASWSWDAGRRKLVTYDTVGMARKKAQFVRDRGLGGAMWWESSADKTGPDSLIGNVVQAFGGPGGLRRQENCVTQPHTKYDNLRAGFE